LNNRWTSGGESARSISPRGTGMNFRHFFSFFLWRRRTIHKLPSSKLTNTWQMRQPKRRNISIPSHSPPSRRTSSIPSTPSNIDFVNFFWRHQSNRGITGLDYPLGGRQTEWIVGDPVSQAWTPVRLLDASEGRCSTRRIGNAVVAQCPVSLPGRVQLMKDHVHPDR
jgi:hypothetical protein